MTEANTKAHTETALMWFGFCEARARNLFAARIQRAGQHIHTLSEYEDLRHETKHAYEHFASAHGSRKSALFMDTHFRYIDTAWKIQQMIDDVHRNRNNA